MLRTETYLQCYGNPDDVDSRFQPVLPSSVNFVNTPIFQLILLYAVSSHDRTVLGMKLRWLARAGS